MNSDWQTLAIVIHSLDGGGSEHAAAAMASFWADAGKKVFLVTLDEVENDRIPFSPRVERIGLGMMGDSTGLWSAIKSNRNRVKALRAALLNSAPDRVISLTDRTNVLTLLASKGTDLKVVVSERTDIRHHQIGRVWGWLRNRTYPTACSIIVQTEAVRSAMQPISGRTPVCVIPNSVLPPKTNSVTQELDLPGTRNLFVAVGRLSFEKGFDRLIDAFSRITRNCPDWDLVIIGDGPERLNLLDAASKSDLTDRIHFPVWIESPWAAVIGSQSSQRLVAVLPSRYEGFPNALLEAMSHGIAPISFDCESGPSEIIRHNENGLLVPQDNVAELATAMQSLSLDDDLRTQLAASAREVNDRFSPESVYAQWEAVLSDCR